MKSVAVGIALIPALVLACPGSASKMHAKCDMTVSFTDSCDIVIAEISGRVSSADWVDPHNGGTYSISNSTAAFLSGQRVTGDQKYTDLFDFSFTDSDRGCIVEACSESQVMSMKDFSTNYCNLHDLYCSSADGCPTAGKDLTYSEQYGSCSEHDSGVCVATSLSSAKKTGSKSGDSEACSDDIKAATADITAAGVYIAKAVTDCADGFTDPCNADIDAIMEDLTKASADITAAVYDCAGEVPTACADDVNAVLADVTEATVSITDAVVDCAEGTLDEAKCTKDIAAASAAITHAGFDIAKCVEDCA